MIVVRPAHLRIMLSIFAGLILSAGLNAQDVHTANLFVQPNDTTLNWYGSGDANGDDTLTSADLTRMQAVINGAYVPDTSIDRRAYDRMDINGDEIVNQQDYNIMENHFQTRAPRDPIFYWANRTPIQKQDWLEKMLAIDKTDEIPGSNNLPYWDCNQWAIQLMTNFHGFSPEHFNTLTQVHPNMNLTNNNRFNLPMLSTKFFYFDSNGDYEGGHEINNLIMRNNVFDLFNSQNFIEPQNDKTMQQTVGYLTYGESSKTFIKGPPILEEGIIGFPGDYTLDLAAYFYYNTEDEVTGEHLLYYPDLNKYNINLITEKKPINLGILTNINPDSTYEFSPTN